MKVILISLVILGMYACKDNKEAEEQGVELTPDTDEEATSTAEEKKYSLNLINLSRGEKNEILISYVLKKNNQPQEGVKTSLTVVCGLRKITVDDVITDAEGVASFTHKNGAGKGYINELCSLHASARVEEKLAANNGEKGDMHFFGWKIAVSQGGFSWKTSEPPNKKITLETSYDLEGKSCQHNGKLALKLTLLGCPGRFTISGGENGRYLLTPGKDTKSNFAKCSFFIMRCHSAYSMLINAKVVKS